MKQEIIKIGNSKGARIPSAFYKEMGEPSSVNIELRENEFHTKELVLTPISKPRSGWKKRFSSVTEDLIPDSITSEWEASEWEW